MLEVDLKTRLCAPTRESVFHESNLGRAILEHLTDAKDWIQFSRCDQALYGLYGKVAHERAKTAWHAGHFAQFASVLGPDAARTRQRPPVEPFAERELPPGITPSERHRWQDLELQKHKVPAPDDHVRIAIMAGDPRRIVSEANALAARMPIAQFSHRFLVDALHSRHPISLPVVTARLRLMMCPPYVQIDEILHRAAHLGRADAFSFLAQLHHAGGGRPHALLADWPTEGVEFHNPAAAALAPTLVQPIHIAARGPGAATLRSVLESPEVNPWARSSSNRTALHEAIDYGNRDAVTTLVRAGRQTFVQEPPQVRSYLAAAVESGRVDILRAVLKEPWIERNQRDALGTPPLGYAVALMNEPIIHLLLEDAAVSHTYNYHTGEATIVDHALHGDTSAGLTTLLSLAQYGRFAPGSNDGRGYLQAALKFAIHNGKPHVLAELLRHPEVELHCLDAGDETAVGRALKSGRPNIVRQILLSGRVDLTRPLPGEDTFFHIAARHSDPQMLEALNSVRDIHGATVPPSLNFNAYNTYGVTPLHIAAENPGRLLWFLKQPGIDVGARSRGYADHAIHFAINAPPLPGGPANANNLDALRLLTAYARRNNDVSMLNLQGRGGLSPLHLATLYRKHAYFDFLLEQPETDLNARCQNGFSPLHYAIRHRDRTQVARLFADPRVNAHLLTTTGLNYREFAALCRATQTASAHNAA